MKLDDADAALRDADACIKLQPQWAKGFATNTISPRHKKARSPVERQQYEILHEVRRRREAVGRHVADGVDRELLALLDELSATVAPHLPAQAADSDEEVALANSRRKLKTDFFKHKKHVTVHINCFISLFIYLCMLLL